MTLNLIGLSTVKTQLGISVTTYDAALTALIPIVSSDIRRILNNKFNVYTGASYVAGSTQILIAAKNFDFQLLSSQNSSSLELGAVITGSGIPTDTYLLSYDESSGRYTMSAAATGDGAYIYSTITIAQWPAISKMIWYKYKTQNTTDASARAVTSESYGGVSVSYADSEINKKYNYPQQLINDLGVPYARIG